jgi:hypothetical protein
MEKRIQSVQQTKEAKPQKGWFGGTKIDGEGRFCSSLSFTGELKNEENAKKSLQNESWNGGKTTMDGGFKHSVLLFCLKFKERALIIYALISLTIIYKRPHNFIL